MPTTRTTVPITRNTYRYHFKLGNKIVHTDITYDIDRREAEHQREPGWSKGHIKQVGLRITRADALEWEREQAERGKPVRRELTDMMEAVNNSA